MQEDNSENKKKDDYQKKRRKVPQPATIEYGGLGTMALDQFAQALWEDIKALKDNYNVRFVTNARLIIPATNEYGEPHDIRHPDGHVVTKYDSHAYTPACWDYKL